mmetsp:Transcript_27505/g.43661  ORF Transcript_27505/g.43661 Transcript_27505/m.43661 type:complete len:83 (-) Transcript_27505:60-308(-)
MQPKPPSTKIRTGWVLGIVPVDFRLRHVNHAVRVAISSSPSSGSAETRKHGSKSVLVTISRHQFETLVWPVQYNLHNAVLKA